jgi:shikimate kinase
MPHRPQLALIGPMGAGKSSIGRALAGLLERPFIDLDRAIEAAAGAEIPLIFELEGEAGFRRREREALAAHLAGTGAVIACGGGVILDPDNRQLLRERAFVVHLVASVDEQLERLARDRSRPLLRTGDRRERLRELAREREPLYAGCADLSFHGRGGAPAVAARELAGRLVEISPDLVVRDDD